MGVWCFAFYGLAPWGFGVLRNCLQHLACSQDLGAILYGSRALQFEVSCSIAALRHNLPFRWQWKHVRSVQVCQSVRLLRACSFCGHDIARSPDYVHATFQSCTRQELRMYCRTAVQNRTDRTRCNVHAPVLHVNHAGVECRISVEQGCLEKPIASVGFGIPVGPASQNALF